MQESKELILLLNLSDNYFMIESASLYKLGKKNKILVHGVSRIDNGPSIASEPFIWLEGNAPTTTIIEQILFTLNTAKTELPMSSNWKEFSKDFLRKTGLKKQSDLYIDSILIEIFKRDGVLYFTPMRNLGSNGFVNVSKEKIEISEKADTKDLVRALEEALNKCE